MSNKIYQGCDWGGLCGITTLYDYENKERCLTDFVANMLNKTQSIFQYDGLPDTIPARELELQLQTNGHVGWELWDGKLYAFSGGRSGMPGPYNLAQNYLITNVYFNKTQEYEIDKDVIVMSNDSLWVGLMPLLRKYGTLLVENELSLRVANINTRMITLMSSGDERTLSSIKDYIKSIEAGKLTAIVEPRFLTEDTGLKTTPYAQGTTAASNILNLIELEQYLKGSLLMELGIKAPFNMKREALGDSENGLQDASLLPLIDDMLKCRQIALDKINARFGTNITVKKNSAWEDIELEPEHQQEEAQEEIDEQKEEVEMEKEEEQDDEEVKNDDET